MMEGQNVMSGPLGFCSIAESEMRLGTGHLHRVSEGWGVAMLNDTMKVLQVGMSFSLCGLKPFLHTFPSSWISNKFKSCAFLA